MSSSKFFYPGAPSGVSSSDLKSINQGEHVRRDKNGDTLFHKYCRDSNIPVLKYMLRSPHLPNDVFIQENFVRETPLSIACKNNQSLETLEFISSLNSNDSSKKYTFLVDSVFSSIKAIMPTTTQAHKILKLLFKLVSIVDCIAKAARVEDVKIAEFVLSNIIPDWKCPNDSDFAVIDILLKTSDDSVVKFSLAALQEPLIHSILLCRAAKIHKKPEVWVQKLSSKIDRRYVNPILCYAVKNDLFEMFCYFVNDMKFDVNSVSSKSGDGVLHVAVTRKNIKIVKYLAVEKQGNCDLNIRNKMGKSPLTIACDNNLIHIIKCLIDSPHCKIDELHRYPKLLKKFEPYVKYHQALKGSGSLEINVVKCILTGPPGSGKSTLEKKLLHIPLSDGVSYSTGVCDAPIPVTRNIHQQKAIGTSNDLVSWKSQDLEEEAVWIMEKLSTNKEPVSLPIPNTSDDVSASRSDNDDEQYDNSDDDDDDDDDAQTNTDSVAGPFLRNRSQNESIDSKSKAITALQSIIKRLPAKKRSEILHTSDAQSNLSMYIIDTGGQPEFHELLPTLITGPAINLLVFKLTEDLSSTYQITYRSPDGNSEPYSTSLSHEEFVFRSLNSIASLRQHTIGWEFEQSPVQDNSEPAALLIATHRDLVSESKVTEVNQQLTKKIQESSQLYRKNLVRFSSSGVSIFAIDTRNDKYVGKVQKAVDDVIERNFCSHKIPASWLVFSLMLRKKNKSFIKKDTCFNYARQVGIKDESEFKAVLWYLHHRVGTILYYPKVADLNDVIITDLQPIFQRLTDLITSSFTFKTLKSDSTENEFRTKGHFSNADLEKLPRKAKKDPFTPKRLVALLKHVNVVAGPIETADGSKCYFMPCALTPAAAADLKINIEQPIPPLLVYFNHGYTPVGVFCCLVVHLLSQTDHKMTWNLPNDIVHNRNKITFFVGDCYDKVILISQATHIEVWVERSTLNNKLSDEFFCEQILSVVNRGLKKVTRSLHYNQESEHIFGFLCDCSNSLLPHPAVIERSNEAARCVSSDHLLRYNKEHLLWLNKIRKLKSISDGSKTKQFHCNNKSCLNDILDANSKSEVSNLLERFHKLEVEEESIQDRLKSVLAPVLLKESHDDTSVTSQELIDTLRKIEDEQADEIVRILTRKRKSNDETFVSKNKKTKVIDNEFEGEEYDESSRSKSDEPSSKRGRYDDNLNADVACDVLAKNFDKIIYAKINLQSFADELLKEEIIDDQKKSEITDPKNYKTTPDRLRELLDIVIATIRGDGEVFGTLISYFESRTKREKDLAKKLSEAYKEAIKASKGTS